MRLRFVHIFLFLFCLRLNAQAPAVRIYSGQDLGELHFTVTFQDSHGWIWAGAQDGVYRFDGQVFMPVRLPENMESSPVSALFETDGKICAGFKNGQIAYLPNYFSRMPLPSGDVEEDKRRAPVMVLWQPEEGLPKSSITGFCADGRGGIWIATYGEGVYVWKEERLYQYNQAEDGLAGDDVYAITCDAAGRVWAATDGGISQCAMPEKGKKEVHNLSRADGLPDEVVRSLAIDPQGNLWGGTDEKGVFRYNTATKQVDILTPEWPFGAVTALGVFGNAEVWVGTEKAGLIRFDGLTGATNNMPSDHFLAENRIRHLLKDREGLLWIIADRGTLCSSNVRFGMWRTPFSNVQAILTDGSNRIWAGCREGLYVQKGQSFEQVLPQKDNVVSLWESPSDGLIWVGTLGNGVYVLNQGGKVVKRLTEGAALQNGSVLSISGNREKVWLATLGGVTVLDARSGKVETGIDLENLGSFYVYKVFTDSKGNIWFGTDGKGLIVYNSGSFQAYTEAAGIRLRTIYSIAEDRTGHIWFSTDRDGLFRFDGKEFRHYTTANRLHSMEITGLAADGTGKIVIGYEDGFDILNPDRFDHVNFCSTEIGAPKVEINLNALWTDKQGGVWLGAQNGIVRSAAYPEYMMDDPQPGITGITTLSHTIDFLQKNAFSYDQNYFLFNFLGLWYTNPDAVRYRYRLEGFDPVWQVSKDHTASYPKLPPGDYTFRVQTSEHGNFENVPEASWTFRISRPFWQQWWFIVLAILALATVFAAFIRARDERLRREALLVREKVQSQFETLKSQINPHFLFNSFNTLITIIEENPKVAVEYVEHLSDFYRSIMVYRERDLIKLGEELELVRSFDYLLKKRYEDGFLLVDKVNGEKQFGQVMPLSLQMLVENAVKHNIISTSKPLTVEIFTQNGHIVVRNNIQRKIKPEASTHFGLHSLINRYKLLSDKPVIVEENNTYFIVKLPLL